MWWRIVFHENPSQKPWEELSEFRFPAHSHKALNVARTLIEGVLGHMDWYFAGYKKDRTFWLAGWGRQEKVNISVILCSQ